MYQLLDTEVNHNLNLPLVLVNNVLSQIVISIKETLFYPCHRYIKNLFVYLNFPSLL